VSRKGHANPLRHRGPTRLEMLAIFAGVAVALCFALTLPFGFWTL
jgi:hypothetical protein